MALDKLTKVQSVGISSFIQVVGVVTATGGFVGDLTGNITGTTSNASGATGDFSIADKIVHTGDTNTAIRFPAADTFTVETAGSEAIRVSAGGSFGIATTDPATPLSVREATNITTYGNVSAQFSDNSTGTLYVQHSSGLVQVGSDTALSFGSGTSADERLRVASDGKVGIGEDSPDRLLHIKGASSTAYSGGSDTADYNFLKIENTTNDKSAGIFFQIGGNGEAAITATEVVDGNTDISFQNRGGGVRSEKLRIASNGDIGIANASPTNWGAGVPTIEIKGTVSSGGNSTRSGAIAFESGSGNNGYSVLWGWNGGIHIYTGATDRASATFAAQFNSSGNLAFASGNGIDFSATSNSSGSVGSEVFDDYEEGTWTPQITQGVSGTPGYSLQIGWYTKIGRIVTLYFYLRFSSSGNTGSNSIFRVGNFPFPVASNHQNTYNRGMGVSNFHSIPGFTSANISFYGGGSSNTYASTYQGSTPVGTSSALNNQYIIGGFEYISE